MFLLKRLQKLILKDCQQEAGLLLLLAPAILVRAGPAALVWSPLQKDHLPYPGFRWNVVVGEEGRAHLAHRTHS